MIKDDFSGINWTYTQLFPNRDSYTLSDPTHFINNHRKLNYRPTGDVQINLDYLDMLEEISSYPHQRNDHLVLGSIFSGHLILENAVVKSVYLNQEKDITTVISECQKRIPQTMYLMHEKDGKVFKYNGTNTGKAAWHSAVENYTQFIKHNFVTLIKALNYENIDYRELKNSFLKNELSVENSKLFSQVINNLYFRMIHFESGYYELTSNYPKVVKISKSSVINRLLERVKNNYRALDESYGIYYVSGDQKLFKVMPKE